MTKINYKKGASAILIIGIIVLAAAVALGVYFAARPSEPASSQTQKSTSSSADVEKNNTANGQPSQSSEKNFTVNAKSFSFDPSQINVRKGDKVKITLVNSGGFHDWVIDEFNARTERINGGAQTSIEFVADKTGTFEYYCSVGNHRQMGMKGNLIVSE